jgi:hypothetical protein
MPFPQLYVLLGSRDSQIARLAITEWCWSTWPVTTMVKVVHLGTHRSLRDFPKFFSRQVSANNRLNVSSQAAFGEVLVVG